MTSFKISEIETLNGKYGIFRTLNPNYSKGEFLFSIEDSFVTRDMDTLCGSGILEGYRPPFEAESVIKMKEAGGTPVGKTNMAEFGTSPFITDSRYGIPKNPYDTNRTCGGPSAGAACAASVLDGTVSLSLSICGSVSNSAAYCGVYGMVPTYGKISKNGVIDSGSSVDRVGILSSDSNDMKRCSKLLMNSEDKDSEVITIGVPENITENVSENVKNNFKENCEILKSLGFEMKTIGLPSLKHAEIACRVLMTVEASTSLARYCGMRYGKQDGDYTLESDDFFTSVRTEHFGTGVKKNILLGTYMRMENSRERYYNKARMVRELIIEEYRSAFEGCDVILTPSNESVAPTNSKISKMSMVESFSADRFTAPPDLAGMPVLSVPCGYDDNGMPMGMLFTANHNEEGKLFTLCKTWSENFDMIGAEVIL